ncbi:DUF3325 domain-containing protein [Stenotrophomonas sp.]|uniref:DUF3325 domain-containing protein n=1 Tax=Stenotrophomonas sp. TaxID=69392 RepID=UPI0028AAB69E|nr:DUF3325 domain-containing protein [Stenotrophomonas sp.]
MIHALVFLLALAGFGCLALAMERHQRDLLKRALAAASSRRLRIAGTSMLMLGFALCVAARGLGLGLAQFSGHTSVAAGLLVAAMAFHLRPRT